MMSPTTTFCNMFLRCVVVIAQFMLKQRQFSRGHHGGLVVYIYFNQVCSPDSKHGQCQKERKANDNSRDEDGVMGNGCEPSGTPNK